MTQPLLFEVVSHAQSTASDEYYTPEFPFIAAVREVFDGRIDLDPASCLKANQHVRAEHYYTKESNGLNHPWQGNVFLNPPYSKMNGRCQVGVFFEKLLQEYHAGRVTQGILLCNVSTSAKWFHPLTDYPICFVNRRIAFLGNDGVTKSRPMYDNCFVYIGEQSHVFNHVFSSIGNVMVKAEELNGRESI